MKFIIAMVLIFALVVILLAVMRPSGPRITTIEHRRDEEDEAGRDERD
jgi:hypothetical protein